MMKQRDKCPYQRIEYLEVSAEGGKAWIDTMYIPNGTDIDIYGKFMPLQYLNDYSVWFSTLRETTSDAPIYRICNQVRTSNQLKYTVANLATGGSVWLEIPPLPLNVAYTFELLSTRVAKFNNSQYPLPAYNGIGLNKISLILFDRGDGERITYGRFYSFRLDKGGIPQLDLIPVRIGTVGYMYDRVSGKLFGNSGTGRFILGPDIN